jgi:hypothetical protein
MPDHVRARISLIQTSATYRDQRIAKKDAVVLSEVIEHLDPDRLGALERSVFHDAAPRGVIVTTPNAEFNPLYPFLPRGTMRHPDHRFEWTRAQFAQWAAHVADRHGYAARIEGVGLADPELGAPTQMAVFTRAEAATGQDPATQDNAAQGTAIAGHAVSAGRAGAIPWTEGDAS